MPSDVQQPVSQLKESLHAELENPAIALAAIMTASPVSIAQERDQIRIVGSSTVYPFASYVTEEFGAITEYPTPTIESTGSGGGMRIFCEGIGGGHPGYYKLLPPNEAQRV